MKQYLSEAWIRSYTNDVQCVTECTRKNDYLSSFFFNNKMAPTTIFNLLLKLNSNTSLAEVTKISPLKVRTKNLQLLFSRNKKRQCNRFETLYIPSSLNIISCLSYTLYLLSSLNIIGWGSCTLYSLSS